MTEFSYLIITLKNFLKLERLFFAFKNTFVSPRYNGSIQTSFFYKQFLSSWKKKHSMVGVLMQLLHGKRNNIKLH
jgi:hypothetical protein